MSLFNPSGKPTAIKPKTAPIIRKVLVTKKVTRPSSVLPHALKSYTPTQSKSSGRPASAGRKELGSGLSSQPRRTHKRGASTPDALFTSDSEGESGDDIGVEQPRKKTKAGSLSPELGRKRRVRDARDYTQDGLKSFSFVHSADLVSGEQAKKYLAAFDSVTESIPEILLQYPGGLQRERYELVVPRKEEEHDPLTDIVESITRILDFYIPTTQSRALLDPSSGIPFLLTRARNHRDLAMFINTVKEFNSTIRKANSDGKIAEVLDAHRSIPLDLTERIMKQVYERTISPQSDSLRKYESFSDSTYGEILPRFAAQIFREARLTPSSVFLDLGSGVGSVVLQAALEYGCESWGIEFEDAPSALAEAQAAELRARAWLWGISVGQVSLLEGDFFADSRLSQVLPRADVILVNNQAFSSATNDRLVNLFLDVKQGARIVSLKSFVPQGFQLTTRTSSDPRAALSVKHMEYWTGCVSWKDDGGDYYIATKDHARLRKFLGEDGGEMVEGRAKKRVV